MIELLHRLREMPLYRELLAAVHSSEGNTLEGDDDRALARLSTIVRTLEKHRPLSVIETGTQKGLFGIILIENLFTFRLTTFDINPESAKAAELLGARFVLGDTRQTFSAWNETADFAWIDGGHWGGVAASDIRNAMRLGIPVILVDDMDIPEVLHDVAVVAAENPGYRLSRDGEIAIFEKELAK